MVGIRIRMRICISEGRRLSVSVCVQGPGRHSPVDRTLEPRDPRNPEERLRCPPKPLLRAPERREQGSSFLFISSLPSAYFLLFTNFLFLTLGKEQVPVQISHSYETKSVLWKAPYLKYVSSLLIRYLKYALSVYTSVATPYWPHSI